MKTDKISNFVRTNLNLRQNEHVFRLSGTCPVSLLRNTWEYSHFLGNVQISFKKLGWVRLIMFASCGQGG